MALLLGIDTGGTYTDAVLYDDAAGQSGAVIATAKALTTRHDLSIGIGGAITTVMEIAAPKPSEIALVSLSTTLATNAVVEGQGGKIGLVLIGLDERALERADLKAALGEDPFIAIAGGHDAHGSEHHAPDLAAVTRWLTDVGHDLEGYAVAGEFAVRNPGHEIAVRELVRAETGKPVTCSHELSSRLDGPRRALTSVLNARLIGLIDRLIRATRTLLEQRGIAAPLMVVRGDGALISAEVAQASPVETILSGPAASLVGAAHLTGRRDGIVSDIGGTTTDVAILRDGMPRIDSQGACVGGWRTMIEAVAMRTIGLGGDSEVRLERDGLTTSLALGPRRAVPVSLFAIDHRELVLATLERQLNSERPGELDGRFAFATRGTATDLRGLRDLENRLVARLDGGPMALDKLIELRMEIAALARLVSRGVIMVSGLTPTDAAHVLGLQSDWDRSAAASAAILFARHRDARGQSVFPDGKALAGEIIATLHQNSADILLETAFDEDGLKEPGLSRHPLVKAARAGNTGSVSIDIRLRDPVIALGASAATYYPQVARLLKTEAIVPEHAEVANALGAVVGNVRIVRSLTISQPQSGAFQVFLSTGITSFAELAQARSAAEKELNSAVRAAAQHAGAAEVTVTFSHDEKTVTAGGQTVFLEATVHATASGRPRACG